MPYSNEQDYQILLKRHLDKGRLLSNVNEKVLGKKYSQKIESSKRIFSSYCINPKNKKYSALINQGYNSDFGKGNVGIEYLQARLNSTISRTAAPSSAVSPKAIQTLPTEADSRNSMTDYSRTIKGLGALSDCDVIKVSSLLTKDRKSHEDEQPCFSPTAQRNRNIVLENINALVKARKKHENSKSVAVVENSKNESKARELLRQKINSLRTKFDQNVDGAVVHGRTLSQPPLTKQLKELQEGNQFKPDQHSLDLAYMSFKPGLSSKQRLSIQQQTTFYSQKFGDDFSRVDDGE